jgi:hypothetical protein
MLQFIFIMKFILRILLFLIWNNPYVSAFEIQRQGESLFLSGTNCVEVNVVFESLKAWTVSLNEDKSCHLTPQKSELGCTVNIDSCVPNHVFQYQGVNPKKFGPNCWNLALVMKGILPALRYSTAEEMSFYMKSPLCRQLGENEKRLPGDIGAIRDVGQGQSEVHGFIYISDKLAYSKNGPDEKNPFAIQSLNEVYKIYDVPNKNECRGNTIKMNTNCTNALSFFRCKSIDSYLQDTEKLPQFLDKSLKEVDRVEKCLQLEQINEQIVSSEARKNLVDVSEALVFYLKERKSVSASSNLSEKEKFTLTALQLRLQALSEQFANNNDLADDYSREISRFSYKIKYALRDLSR